MATNDQYRRAIYRSVPAGGDFGKNRADIIVRSRAANGLDGVTGILWSAPDLYVQVLEGSAEAIEPTLGRIRADDRHHSVEVLADTLEDSRLFGSWSMAGLPGIYPADAITRLRKLLISLGGEASQLAERVQPA